VLSGLVALLLGVGADASKPRLRLERIDTSEFDSDGTIRVFASLVELEGAVVDDRAGPSFVLKMGRKTIGKPLKAQPNSADPLDLVLVVESSALYGPKKVVEAPLPPPAPKGKGRKGETGDAGKPAKGKGKKVPAVAPPAATAPARAPAGPDPLDKVKEAAHALLEGLGPRHRVLLIDYGADVTPHPPFRPAQSLDGDVDDLVPDGEAGDLSLVRALNAALLELGRPRPDGRWARQMIVVISDGLNSQMDHRTFRALGDAAGRAHVPIHTIAFSPHDERGPLLNLGEISKRSHGTFRWARTADDLRVQIDTLAEQLNKQYVLTYKLEGVRSLEGKSFQLVSEDLVSNAYNIGDVPVTRSLMPWWLWLLAGLVIAGGVVAIVIVRRRPKKAMKFSPYKTGGSQAAAPQPHAAQPRAAQAQAQAQPQRPPSQPSAAVVTAPAATRGVLIVVSGALAGQRLAVAAQPITIGKGPSTLQINDDPTVSTRHAEVAQRGGAFVVTDLGSTNGTFVNNQRIAQPARLTDGDLLRFGNTQMKFRTE
jgi:hypothetical protein